MCWPVVQDLTLTFVTQKWAQKGHGKQIGPVKRDRQLTFWVEKQHSSSIIAWKELPETVSIVSGTNPFKS